MNCPNCGMPGAVQISEHKWNSPCGSVVDHDVVWGKPSNPCIEIATLRKRVEGLEGALVWCSGSSDFAPGGIAEAGWNNVCRPLLQALGGAGGANEKRD